MRWRSVVLGAAVLLSALSLPATGSAAVADIHLVPGAADGNGCHPLELWNGDTLVQSFAPTWDGEHCAGANLKHLTMGSLFYFDWWPGQPIPGGSQGTLWATDGTPGGTVAVSDLVETWDTLRKQSTTSSWFLSGHAIYVELDVVSWQVHHRRLSATTGLEPVQALDLHAVTVLGEVGGRLFVMARRTATGRELYVTDGTLAGTHVVRDIRPGPAGSNPGRVVRIGTHYYFSANDGIHGRELWTTSLTPRGTRLVRDIQPGPGGSSPHMLHASGSQLCFHARVPGALAWVSDGSWTGTRPGSCSAA
ncbi:MAG: hypothetical protein U0869_07840 [Chloroflexota bacterium]